MAFDAESTTERLLDEAVAVSSRLLFALAGHSTLGDITPHTYNDAVRLHDLLTRAIAKAEAR